jgi:GNAT superfamily N-acetyltransferase
VIQDTSLSAVERFSLPRYEVVYLDLAHRDALQRLHERCAEYINLISGAPPAADAAEQLLDERPPGTNEADKLVLGVYSAGQLVAAVDLIRNYPNVGTWWVGNLMVEPDCRGKGLGARLYEACESWMATYGARRIGLCVQEQNPAAYRFWMRMGYRQTKQVTQRINSLESNVAVMYRSLAAEQSLQRTPGPNDSADAGSGAARRR